MPPSEKDTKFDRQLRLWGSDGQSSLENAHIALVGATPVGCEVLKDLILPNIGKFTIIDDKKIQQEDIAANFFVESDSLNKSRAKVTKELLNELNEDVEGNFIDNEPLGQLLKKRHSFLAAFLDCGCVWCGAFFIIASLDDVVCSGNSLGGGRINGLFGYLLISVGEHTIIESHPSSFVDLRLDRPWPELVEFTNQYNLGELDDIDVAHVPYIVLLLKYLDLWKQTHSGNSPKTSADKREFKKFISSGKRVTADGENYDEAINSSWRLFTDSSVPVEITNIVNDEKTSSLTQDSPDFWILASALKEFIQLPESNGALPVTGVLPDMVADTIGFVKMQQIYRDKAKKDINTFHLLLNKILEKIGRPTDSISREQIETFCKNSRNLKVIRGFSLDTMYNTKKINIDGGIDTEENERFGVFLAIEIAKLFHEQHGRFLGRISDDAKLQEDLEIAKSIGNLLLEQLGLGRELPAYTLNVLQEIARAGSYELHNVSSFLGGVGSQETVKLITKQYTLLDNLMVFDGVVSKGQNWKV